MIQKQAKSVKGLANRKLRRDEVRIDGKIRRTMKCWKCDGRGRRLVYGKVCYKCGGKGYLLVGGKK